MTDTQDRDDQATPQAGVSPADRDEGSPPHPLPVRAPLPEVRESQAMPLLALHRALDHMVADIDRLADAGDLEGLTAGFSALDAFLKAARDVRNHAEDHITTLMPQNKVNLHDQFTLERHTNRNHKWQSEDLLRHLVGDTLVDPETGENVYERLVACVPFTPSLSWRAGALRDHGIDPDEWREATSSRKTVTVKARTDD